MAGTGKVRRRRQGVPRRFAWSAC